MYENNIKQSYVERYVDVSWHEKELAAVVMRSGSSTRSLEVALSTAPQIQGARQDKDFRTMLRKADYSVYLVDEFRVCANPRPYRSDSILRHGLVRCATCSRLWDRDTNAASNIWKVAVSAIRGAGRPAYPSKG
ncbi:hypothetical protein Gpo141_00011337 [Globisporangium polare]